MLDVVEASLDCLKITLCRAALELRRPGTLVPCLAASGTRRPIEVSLRAQGDRRQQQSPFASTLLLLAPARVAGGAAPGLAGLARRLGHCCASLTSRTSLSGSACLVAKVERSCGCLRRVQLVVRRAQQGDTELR